MGDTPYSGGKDQTLFTLTLSAEEMAQLAKIDDAVFTTAQWLFLSLFTIADYYTVPQIDSIILSHTHDGRYYTENEIDSMFAEHAALSHTHGDRYYTEEEIDSLLSDKSDTTHNHGDQFVLITTAQTIAGVKTFSSIPVLPASNPTADNDAVRKAYVDNQIANHDSQHDDEIKAIAYPVGSFYIQFPDANSNDDATAFPTSKRPATLFGGTWAEQWSTEYIFFRTGGTTGQARSSGLSADQFQGHYHYDYGGQGGTNEVSKVSHYASNNTTTTNTGGVLGPYTGEHGAVRFGSFTEPRNRLIKVWKRTA